jgi:hypothetical protein
MKESISRILQHLAIGSLTGIVAGVIAGGLGSRLAMRISAMMTDYRLQGTHTEAQARVGEITLGGTFFLVFFAGILGIYGGLLYRLIAARLPVKTWQKGLGFGISLLLLHGTMLIEGDNFDFERFGNVYLNLAMFIFIPIAFGLIAAYTEAWLEKRYPAFAFHPLPLFLYLPALLGILVLGMLLVTQVQGLNPRNNTGIGSMEQMWLTLVMIALMLVILLFEPMLSRLKNQTMVRAAILAIPMFYGGFLLFRAISEIIASA